jgi:acetyl esterase/lipase
MTIFARGMVLLLAALAAAGCARHVNAPELRPELPQLSFTLSEGLRYSPDDWPQALQADLYVPNANGRFPAVLLVHGGGWERRSRDDMVSIAERLATSGFVVMNIDYRFAPEHIFPAQLNDLQQAMHWLHRNAEAHSIDVSRIGGFGFSSGAHLVSLLALVAGEGGELDQPYGGERTRLRAVVAGGTPTDLSKYGGGNLVPQFLGGTREAVPERFALASPVSHVHSGAPPFFLYHGGADWLVPSHHARDFKALLDAAGVDNELYILRGRGHVGSFLTGGSAEARGVEFLHRQMPAPRD